MSIKKLLVLSCLILLAGCTKAELKQVATLGHPAHIVCYSGGKIILDTYSTGKVSTETESDGWYWEDVKSKKLIRTNAQCVIEN